MTHRKMTRKTKSIIICSVIAAVMIMLAAILSVALNHKDDDLEGIWYCDSEEEYDLTLNKGNYLLSAGKTFSGKYSREDDRLELDCGISGTVGEAIALNIEGGEYIFLPRVNCSVTFIDDETQTRTVLRGRAIDEPTAFKEGYNFLGWYLGGVPYDFSLPVMSDLTLTAKWEAKTDEYAVTLDYGYVTVETLTKGGKIELDDAEWEGHTFCGWWLSDYNDRDMPSREYKGETISEDTMLFARYDEQITVSVEGDKIFWTGGEAMVKITGENLMRAKKAVGEFEFSFSACPAGEFIVEVQASYATGYAFIRNKALGVPSRINANNGVMFFDEVPYADGYLVGVKCGNVEHNHSSVNIGGLTHYNFSNCPMREGGIEFTVTAYADGYLPTSNVFVYNRELSELALAQIGDETIGWTAIEGASYIITVTSNGNVERFETEETSFCYKYYSGTFSVSVQPVLRGFNSTAVSTEITKNSLAAPKGLRIVGDTLLWQPVVGAEGYTVMTGGETVFTAETKIKVTKGDVKVRADGKDNSLYSEIYVSDTLEPSYYASTVSWDYVIGAQWYEVRLNDGEPIRTECNFAEIELDRAGENHIYVRTDGGEWKSIAAFAHTVILDSLGGSGQNKLFRAVGDVISLPICTKTGYDFGGWYSCPNGGIGNGRLYDDNKFLGTGDIALYAYWKPKTFTVTFGEQRKSVTFGTDFILSAPQSDYRLFVGWYYDGIKLTDGSGVGLKAWDIASDITVVAQWIDIFTFIECEGALKASGGEGLNLIDEATLPQQINGMTVTEIDDYAFAGRTVKSINLPPTIVKIGVDAFYECRYLQSIECASDAFRSDDGVLIDIAGGMFFYPAAREGSFTVPQEVTRILPKQFAASRVERVIVPPHVTEIGEWAFFNCKLLSEVTIEEGEPLEIKEGAFMGCAKLNNIVLPSRTLPFNVVCTFENTTVKASGGNFVFEEGALYNGDKSALLYFDGRGGTFSTEVQRIESGAFGKSNLDEIIIFGAEIAEGAFSGSAIKRVKIVGGSVGRSAFSDCFDLTELELSVDEVGDYAFCNTAIKELSLNDTRVGEYAFSGCMSLKRVTVSGEKTIAESAFFGCEIEVAVLPSSFPFALFKGADIVVFDGETVSDGGAVYTADMTELLYYPDKSREVTLPDAVTKISDGVFENSQIQKIVSKNVTHVGKNAFSGCHNLTTVVFSDQFAVGDYAFFGCEKLNLNATLISIGEYAFSNAKLGSVKAANLEPHCFEGATIGSIELDGDIPECAFMYAKIKSVVIPQSAARVGRNAFAYSELIGAVFESGKNPLEIEDDAFAYCPLTEISLPERTRILGEAFGGCILDKVTLPNSLAKLSTVFANTAIKNINIPSSLSEIEPHAFENCALESITIPSNISRIGEYAFCGCQNLKEVIFEGSPVICDKAFLGCAIESVDIGRATVEGAPFALIEYRATGSELYSISGGVLYNRDMTELIACPLMLERAEVPSTVKKIRAHAFEGGAITEVVLGGETEIGEYAFFDSALKKIVGKIKSVDRCAFSGSKLTGVDLSTAQNIGVSAFDGCPLTNVDLSQAKNIGAYAFRGCSLIGVEVEACVLGAAAFAENKSLIKADIDGAIPSNLFAGCTMLSEVDFQHVNEIGDYAFSQTAVTKATLTVDYIGIGAFSGSKLQEVNLTLSGEFELDGAFDGCDELSGITVTAPNYSSIDGVLYDENGQTLLLCPPAKRGSLEIKSGVKVIASGAFRGSNLSEVILPQTLSEIGTSAFENSKIENIDFGVGYDLNIGERAFAGSALTEADFSGRTVKLHNAAFKDCVSLERADFTGDIPSDLFNGCASLYFVSLGDLSEIGDRAFRDSGLREIVIPSSVRRIGVSIGESFAYCDKLESVQFEDGSSLELIGDKAFLGSGLKEIVVPEGVSEIGYRAFSECNIKVRFDEGDDLIIGDEAFMNSTVDMVLPSRVVKIGNSSFENADGNIEIGQNSALEYIGERAFYGDPLKSVELPDTIEYVGDYAFFLNTGMQKAVLNCEISSYMFSNCASLIDVTLPQTTIIPEGAFNDCVKLEYIELPSMLESIGEGAFKGSGLKEITIPRSVRSIGDEAFWGCPLEKTVIRRGVEFIGDNAFGDAELLLPGSVTSLGISKGTFASDNTSYVDLGGAVYSADMRTLIRASEAEGEFTVPDSVREISEGAFKGSLVTKVILPRITALPQSAFEDCASLGEVILPPSLRSIDAFAFAGCTKLTALSLPRGITTIGAYAFSHSNIQALILPETVTEIGQHSFEYSALKNIIMPQNATHVPAYAFLGCNLLTEITLSSHLRSIGVSAFEGTALTEFDAPVTSIGNRAFFGSTLISVRLPLLGEMGVEAFCNCVKLIRIELGRTRIIGSSAFSGCVSLKEIDLSGVISIGSYAFDGCLSLDLTVPFGVAYVGKFAFNGWTQSQNLTVLSPRLNWDEEWLSGCLALK